jgi:predicted nucleotidyltransferase
MRAKNFNPSDLKLLRKSVKSVGVELAYLFGSTVNGDARVDSDVDLAILLPRSSRASGRFKVRLSLIASLSKLYSKEFDVVVLNDTPSLLFKFITVSQGRLAYRQDEVTQALYESQVLAEYADFRPFIDQYNAAYVAKNS